LKLVRVFAVFDFLGAVAHDWDGAARASQQQEQQ
jgi:hypothetical protein